jgi:hypothetical protein
MMLLPNLFGRAASFAAHDSPNLNARPFMRRRLELAGEAGDYGDPRVAS